MCGTFDSSMTLSAKLCRYTKPPKKQTYGNCRVIAELRQPVAGSMDGSNAWRALVYSFCSPKLSQSDDSTKPYSRSVLALSDRPWVTHSQSSAPTPICHTAPCRYLPPTSSWWQREPNQTYILSDTSNPVFFSFFVLVLLTRY